MLGSGNMKREEKLITLVILNNIMAQNILGLSSEGVDVLNRMHNFMITHRGISPEAASAILGNVMQESTFNHNAVSNKGARGVYQLLGQNYQNYLSYLKEKNWN